MSLLIFGQKTLGSGLLSQTFINDIISKGAIIDG